MDDELDLDALERETVKEMESPGLDLDALEQTTIKEIGGIEPKKVGKNEFEMGLRATAETLKKVPIVGPLVEGYEHGVENYEQEKANMTKLGRGMPNMIEGMAIGMPAMIAGGARGVQDIINTIPGHPAWDFASELDSDGLRKMYPSTYESAYGAGYMVPSATMFQGIGGAIAQGVKQLPGALMGGISQGVQKVSNFPAKGFTSQPYFQNTNPMGTALGIQGQALLQAASQLPGGIKDVLGLAGSIATYGGGTGFLQETGQQALDTGKSGVNDPGKALQAAGKSAVDMLPVAGLMHYGPKAIGKGLSLLKKPEPQAQESVSGRLITRNPQEDARRQIAISRELRTRRPNEQIEATEENYRRVVNEDRLKELFPNMRGVEPTDENVALAEKAYTQVAQAREAERAAKAKTHKAEEEKRIADLEAEADKKRKAREKEREADQKSRETKEKRDREQEERRGRDRQSAEQVTRMREESAMRIAQAKLEAEIAIQEAKRETAQTKTQGDIQKIQAKDESAIQKATAIEEAKQETARTKAETDAQTIELKRKAEEEKQERKRKAAEEEKAEAEEKQRKKREDQENEAKMAGEKVSSLADYIRSSSNEAELLDRLAEKKDAVNRIKRGMDAWAKAGVQKAIDDAAREARAEIGKREMGDANRAAMESMASKPPEVDNFAEAQKREAAKKAEERARLEEAEAQKSPEERTVEARDADERARYKWSYHENPWGTYSTRSGADLRSAIEDSHKLLEKHKAEPLSDEMKELADRPYPMKQDPEQPYKANGDPNMIKDKQHPDYNKIAKAKAAAKEWNTFKWELETSINNAEGELIRRGEYERMPDGDLEFYADNGTPAQRTAAQEVLEMRRQASEAKPKKEQLTLIKPNPEMGDMNVRDWGDRAYGKRTRDKYGKQRSAERLSDEYYMEAEEIGDNPSELDRAYLEDLRNSGEDLYGRDADEIAMKRHRSEIREVRQSLEGTTTGDEAITALERDHPDVAPEVKETARYLGTEWGLPPGAQLSTIIPPQIIEGLGVLWKHIKRTVKDKEMLATLPKLISGTMRDIDIIRRYSGAFGEALKQMQSNLADNVTGMADAYKRTMGEIDRLQMGVNAFETAEKRALIRKGMSASDMDILRGEGEFGVLNEAQREFIVNAKFEIKEFADKWVKPHLEMLEQMGYGEKTGFKDRTTGLGRLYRVLKHYEELANPKAGGSKTDVGTQLMNSFSQGTYASMFLSKYTTHWLHGIEAAASGLSHGPVEFVRGIWDNLASKSVKEYNEAFHAPGPEFEILSDLQDSGPGILDKAWEAAQAKIPGMRAYWDKVNSSPTARKFFETLTGQAIERWKVNSIRTQALHLEAKRLNYKGGAAQLAEDLMLARDGRGPLNKQKAGDIQTNISSHLNRTIGKNVFMFVNRNGIQRNPSLRALAPFTTAMSNQTYALASHVEDAIRGLQKGGVAGAQEAATAATSFAGMVITLGMFGGSNYMARELKPVIDKLTDDPTVYYDLHAKMEKAALLAQLFHRDVHHVQPSIFPYMNVGNSMTEVFRENIKKAYELDPRGVAGAFALAGIAEIGKTIGTTAAIDDWKRVQEALKGTRKLSFFKPGSLITDDERIGGATVKYNMANALADIFLTGEDTHIAELRLEAEKNHDYKTWLRANAPEELEEVTKEHTAEVSKARKEAMQMLGLEGERIKDLSEAEQIELKEIIESTVSEPDWAALIKQVKQKKNMPAEVDTEIATES